VADQDLAVLVAARSARIPGVVAVTLGGSRAQGDHGPDSDWNFGLYYRGQLDPEDVAALGWPGRVFAPGEWGGGVMNGGAWLQVDGRRVDLHDRDLDDVEHRLAEAQAGRFKVERLPF
jgi:predicted nucleotidyltransferase